MQTHSAVSRQRSSRMMDPHKCFSFEKSMARTNSQSPETKTAKHKKSKLSPPCIAQGVSTTADRSPSDRNNETTGKESTASLSAVQSILVPGVGADAAASRSFFGLPKSDIKISSSSLFSSMPSPASAPKTTGSLFEFTPLRETTAGNQTYTSWFSSLRPLKQDTNTTDTISLFSPLLKTTLANDSTFSKTSETKSPKIKETDPQPDGSFKTAGPSTKNTQQGQIQSQVDVPGVALLRFDHRNVYGALSGSSLDKACLNINNPLSTAQSVPKSSSTNQGKATGYPGSSKFFSNMATGLSQINNIADDKATKANSLHSKETPNFFIFGKATTTASKPVPPAFEIKTKSSLFSSTRTMQAERRGFMQLHHTSKGKASGADEQLRTTPLISLTVKEISEANAKTSMFPQYAFLGCCIPESSSLSEKNNESSMSDASYNMFGTTASAHEEPEPILLNTNTPWSAFICGSQGSGKSYTLSAMIENCLYASSSIGKLPKPLAGVVFHNNTASAHNICEAAQLVSLGIKVNVLVSRSNYHALSAIYKNAVGATHEDLLNVQPLVLQSHDLTAERMHRLMAFAEGETAVPLYMEVIMRILREMAITGMPFSYATFKDNLDKEGLQPGQKVMMNMRLNLLQSFLDPSCMKASKKTSSKKSNLLTTSPGTLTIVDLSDPFLDAGTTCTLFDILLSIFLSSRPDSGLLVCLDEAHKFMKNTPAAETFTENLLTVIREQRHNACRVVIATQEPTISPKLLDLCSMTFVHRFSSPDWMATLKEHLAGASDLANVVTSADDSDGGNDAGRKKRRAGHLFEKIINLDVGESLLFAPSAVLEVDEQGQKKELGVGCVKFKTRSRLGADGGQSVLAVRQ